MKYQTNWFYIIVYANSNGICIGLFQIILFDHCLIKILVALSSYIFELSFAKVVGINQCKNKHSHSNVV